MSPESERDWRLYADDILQACGRIRRAVAGVTLDAFRADELRCDAVVRNREIIGEAAKHKIAKRAPQIPWRNIRGMRDILAHGYFGRVGRHRLDDRHDEDRRDRERRPRSARVTSCAARSSREVLAPALQAR